WPRIAVVRQRMEMPAGSFPEHRDEHLLSHSRHLADGDDPVVVQLRGRDATDAPQALDRKRMEKRELPVRWHYEEPVRLGHTARPLGEELGPRDTDCDRQPDLLEHVVAQSHGDLDRRAGDASEAAYVEEGLVDGKALHER